MEKLSPSEPPPVSALLRQAIPVILERWQSRVLASLPDRPPDAPLALGAMLPGFLHTLADALTTPDQDSYTTHQAAQPSEHPIDQALHEFRVLRVVLLEVLQEHGAIGVREREIIHSAIDHGMEEAGLGFAKTQQRALSDQEALYRLLVESARDYAIFTLDLDRQVVTWNPGAERITGYTAEEIIGQSGDALFTPEDRERGAPAREQQTALSAGRAEDERWHQRKDGRRFFASGVMLPLRDGQVRGLAKVMRDITERKQMEEALQERADELAAADERKNEFLAMLAHELRNPLSPILTAVEVMRLRGADDPALQKSREVVDRQVRHMARLIDDLLDVSRITQGKIELRKQPIDLANVVENATASSQSLIQARRHRLGVSAPRGLRVEADPTRMEQVVCNLLNNAAKYTDPGGQIWVSLQREGDAAVLRVRDTGLGIPQEMLQAIFNLFTQISPPPGRGQDGLGLGLNLTQRLVEMHGGSIEARSEGPGAGSEFIVRLPLIAGVTISTPDPTADCEASGVAASLRVLVVDDNVDAAEALADLLPLWGHDVQVAHSGPAALEAAAAFSPAVVLLDIGLPGIDGYEVARQLRQRNGFPSASLVALTGYGQDEDRRRAEKAGFDVHLTKPVDPQALRRLLAKAGQIWQGHPSQSADCRETDASETRPAGEATTDPQPPDRS